jgi:hypothetical protein
MPNCPQCGQPIEPGDDIAAPYTGEYYHHDCYIDGGGLRWNCDFYTAREGDAACEPEGVAK